MSKSADDLKSPLRFAIAIAYECLGTFLMVTVCIGSGGYPPQGGVHQGLLRTPFAVGLSVATAVWGGAHISGAHVNPAVSLAFLATHNIGLLRFFAYVAAQLIGAVVAGFCVKFTAPPGYNDLVGAQLLGEGVTWYQGFLIELIATFLLIFVIFATLDPIRPYPGGSGALMIGLSVTLLHLWVLPFTGCAINPARALGGHVASGVIHDYPYIWIYWMGPAVGSLLAAWLYHLVFAASASRQKAADFWKNFFREML